MDDSRASQATRWWVLRAAFQFGPSVTSPGCSALANVRCSVQQGAISMLSRAWQCRSAQPVGASRARAMGAGRASSTVSKPAWTVCWEGSCVFSVCSCHSVGSSRSRCRAVTRQWVCRRPAAAMGWAQAAGRLCIWGVATQWDSRGGGAALAMRPALSSTRMVVALQGRHSCGCMASTCSKRGSRTVKYCAPESKLPWDVVCEAMRPPTSAACSNTVTW
ncbi:hypothetical protein D3C78_1360130 [compost metagenome]